MDDQAATRKARKEEARRLKRKRIEDAGGVRPRASAAAAAADASKGMGAGGDTAEPVNSNSNNPRDEKSDLRRQEDRKSSSSSRRLDNNSVGDDRRKGFGVFGGPNRGAPHQQSRSRNTPAVSRHRFGGVMDQVPCPNKSRTSTLSMAVPGSVVSNCQTRELRTQLVGQIARAAAVYHVDEIIVFDDQLSSKMRDRGGYHRRSHGDRRDRNGFDVAPRGGADRNEGGGGGDGKEEGQGGEEKGGGGGDDQQEQEPSHRPPASSSDPHTFMARVLQYCECPQYLRRHFFPMHPDLQFAGLLPPLDAPHHVRAGERSGYREGVVLEKKGSTDSSAGSNLVNCGIRGRPVEIDRVLAPGIRCTVKLDPKASYDGSGRIKGNVVSPTAPREDNGTYWGYTTRLASSIRAVFDECPFEGGYDLKIGTSERGDVTVDDKKFGLPNFKHSLIVFGGVAGIEECIDADEGMTLSGKDARKLFDLWVNTCPFQGSRTIRTEEAVLISLARLRPHIAKNGEASNMPKVVKDEDLQFSEDNLSEESSEEEDEAEQ